MRCRRGVIESSVCEMRCAASSKSMLSQTEPSLKSSRNQGGPRVLVLAVLSGPYRIPRTGLVQCAVILLVRICAGGGEQRWSSLPRPRAPIQRPECGNARSVAGRSSRPKQTCRSGGKAGMCSTADRGVGGQKPPPAVNPGGLGAESPRKEGLLPIRSKPVRHVPATFADRRSFAYANSAVQDA